MRTEPSAAQVREKVALVFADVVGVPFDDDVQMETVGEWDSLTHTQLLIALEEAFNIELRFEDAVQMISAGVILAKIAGYLGERAT